MLYMVLVNVGLADGYEWMHRLFILSEIVLMDFDIGIKIMMPILRKTIYLIYHTSFKVILNETYKIPTKKKIEIVVYPKTYEASGFIL